MQQVNYHSPSLSRLDIPRGFWGWEICSPDVGTRGFVSKKISEMSLFIKTKTLKFRSNFTVIVRRDAGLPRIPRIPWYSLLRGISQDAWGGICASEIPGQGFRKILPVASLIFFCFLLFLQVVKSTSLGCKVQVFEVTKKLKAYTKLAPIKTLRPCSSSTPVKYQLFLVQITEMQYISIF